MIISQMSWLRFFSMLTRSDLTRLRVSLEKMSCAFVAGLGIVIACFCVESHAQNSSVAAVPPAVLEIGGQVRPETLSARYFTQSASPSNFNFVPDPSRPGRQVLEMKINNGEPKAEGGWRTEIVPNGDMMKSGIRWYGFEFYIPIDWQVTSKGIVLSQIHGNDYLGLIPVVSLGVTGTKMYLMLGSNTNLINSSVPPSSLNTIRVSPWEASLVTGQWYRLVVRADWSFEPGKGAIDVWINNKVVYSAHNTPNSYDTSGNERSGNYSKMGLYAWDGLGDVSTQRILVRGIALGSSTAHYKDIVDELTK
jgi:hypothetical protein